MERKEKAWLLSKIQKKNRKKIIGKSAEISAKYKYLNILKISKNARNTVHMKIYFRKLCISKYVKNHPKNIL